MQDCLIQGDTIIDNSVLDGAMIGAKSKVIGTSLDISIDFFDR